ncbi:MAG: condensation domain-containing protein, partial [Planctomycetota bacterium]
MRTKLAATLIPKRVILVEEIPRNVNGKVDQAAVELLWESEAVPAERVTDAQPRTPDEFVLVELMRQVIHAGTLGRDDDFFEAGGSSLDAMSVARQAWALSMDVSVEDIFQYRTAASIAARIAPTPRSPVESERTGERSGKASDETWSSAEVSSGEHALWAYQTLNPDSAAYNIQLILTCSDSVNHDDLTRSLTALVRRHPALHTVYENVNGEPLKVAARDARLRIERWRHETPESEIISFGRRPFDLATELPLRCVHLSPPDRPDSVLLTFHHIAVDERAIRILLSEWSSLMLGLSLPPRGIPSPLGPSKPDLDWWEDWLAGCDRHLVFSGDHGNSAADEKNPPVEHRDSDGELVEFQCDETLSARCREAAATCGVSIGTYLMTAYVLLLARQSESQSFAIGCPVQRTLDADENQDIRYAIEALPLACHLNSLDSVRSTCRQLHDQVAKLIQHRNTSAVQLEREFGSLFNTMFALRQPFPRVSLGQDCHADVALADLGVSKFDLTWFVEDSGIQIRSAVEYRRDRFSPDSIELLTERWLTLLSGMNESVDRAIGDL